MPKYEINGSIYEFTNDPTEADIDEIANSSAQKRNTTVMENLGISLGNAAATGLTGVGILGGGALTTMGDTNTADRLYKSTEDTSKEVRDYFTPKDAEQSFGGKVIGMVGTLPLQLLAMPFAPAETGKQMIDEGESIDNSITGTLIDTVGNVAGLKLPASLGGSIGKRIASGAAMNAAQDVATRKAIQAVAEKETTKDIFAPTKENNH